MKKNINMDKVFAYIVMSITVASVFLLMFSIIAMVEEWAIVKPYAIIAVFSAVWIAGFTMLISFIEK